MYVLFKSPFVKKVALHDVVLNETTGVHDTLGAGNVCRPRHFSRFLNLVSKIIDIETQRGKKTQP